MSNSSRRFCIGLSIVVAFVVIVYEFLYSALVSAILSTSSSSLRAIQATATTAVDIDLSQHVRISFNSCLTNANNSLHGENKIVPIAEVGMCFSSLLFSSLLFSSPLLSFSLSQC